MLLKKILFLEESNTAVGNFLATSSAKQGPDIAAILALLKYFFITWFKKFPLLISIPLLHIIKFCFILNLLRSDIIDEVFCVGVAIKK